jgi:hypothetical protein
MVECAQLYIIVGSKLLFQKYCRVLFFLGEGSRAGKNSEPWLPENLLSRKEIKIST